MDTWMVWDIYSNYNLRTLPVQVVQLLLQARAWQDQPGRCCAEGKCTILMAGGCQSPVTVT